MALGQGRHTALRPTLTPAQRELLALTQQVRSPTITPQLQLRARMILLLAQGTTITAIAQQLQVARKIVYKWVKRWQVDGLRGLRDHKSGFPPGRRRCKEAGV